MKNKHSLNKDFLKELRDNQINNQNIDYMQQQPRKEFSNGHINNPKSVQLQNPRNVQHTEPQFQPTSFSNPISTIYINRLQTIS